jgi:GT2 family glycosyltransferase/glycosyltransferase involved in cell wall biosynthesis
MTKSSIAVIVLNWNDADLLPKSVGSLLKQSEKCDVIVVDNASTDDSRKVIESFGNKVTTLWNTKNKGFAGGVNAGIRYALDKGYEFIALLNNDAVADKDWAKHLFAGFTDANIGSTTCSFIHKHTGCYDSTGEIYTTWGLAYPRGRGEPVKGQFDKKTNVTAASGGASMFRADFFRDVGLFDEDFFAYYEDIDLGLRGQLRGWTCKFVPESIAHHATGTTSSRITGFTIYQQLKNQPLLLIKNIPARFVPLILPRFFLAYLSIIAGNLLNGNTTPTIRGTAASLFYIPKKIMQRWSIQQKISITNQDFSTRIVADIPPSNKKLRTLRSRFRKSLRRHTSGINDFSLGVDGTPFFRPIDGIGRYSSNIVASLANQRPDIKITIIGFKGDILNKELAKNLPTSVEFFYIPLPRRIYQGIFSRITPINLAFSLPKFNHVIHLNFTLFPYIKHVCTTHTVFIHDTVFHDIPEVVTPKNLSYLLKKVPWSLRRTTNIATISEFTKKRIHDIYSYPESKIHMVGTGVELTHSNTSKKPRDLPINYILAIGTLEPRKNLESLVNAYLALPEALKKKYSLVLGGSIGWKNDALLSLIESSEYIKHIGYVEDKELPGLYSSASLFVFPSIYEGFGIPILEAMISKVPVLANDIAQFYSIGLDNISYVNTQDIQALSRKLAEILKQPPGEKHLVAAQKYAQGFAWNESADRLWETIMQGRTIV